jgi:hypothetical protein
MSETEDRTRKSYRGGFKGKQILSKRRRLLSRTEMMGLQRKIWP